MSTDGSRWARIKAALAPREWRRAAGLAIAVLGLHVIGFVTLLVFVVPQHFSLGKQGVFGLGLGITAYTLGLRHAFDADHIAAIDGTTRKLMSEGKRPLSVGYWFSLGHSTIVVAIGVALVVAGKSVYGAVSDDNSLVAQFGGPLGTMVSATFL